MRQFDIPKYQFGFHDDIHPVFSTPKGISEKIVKEISGHKKEPDWMLKFRLDALKLFFTKKMPDWGGDLSKINFNDIYYYIDPADKKSRSWDDVPVEIKNTFDKIGIPEAEKKFLAGVGAQYDSEVVYHSISKMLEKKGVIFLDTDTALKKYPEFFKEYFGKVVPPADNKFAALNSAVWSGGSFIYIPKGVKVELPLQAYFRINAKNMGQFERTLIIADEGSYVHYIEGCFVKGAQVRLANGFKKIEEIKIGDKVLTHKGRFREVYHTMKRPYKGKIFTISYYGNSKERLRVTEEHPLLISKRTKKEYRNKLFKTEWTRADEVKIGDYVVYPIIQKETEKQFIEHQTTTPSLVPLGRPYIHQYKPHVSLAIPFGNGVHVSNRIMELDLDSEFYRLVGYYLSEGHVDKEHYITFTFNENEKVYLEDVQNLLKRYFGKDILVGKKRNHGITLTLCSTIAARFFSREFGSTNKTKCIPQWMLESPKEHIENLVLGLWRGDGSLDKKRSLFRFSNVNKSVITGFFDCLLKLGIIASINSQVRRAPKQVMHNVIISRRSNELFSRIVNRIIKNGRKEGSPFYLDDTFLYMPIKKILIEEMETDVFNFSVREDESYVADGVVSHNCTAPIYTTDSLHAAVVEIIVKKGARVRYTTVQNWSKNVYNLVTKRMFVEEEGIGEWVDGNLGSQLTMKYPSVYLRGRKAKGEILSLAFAGKGQHQDAGGKAIHLAPETTSSITSKSVSKDGGRTSYRGLLKVIRGAKDSKSTVRCDALILDQLSRSDTYPTMDISDERVTIGHEASVSRIGEEQLFYFQSRGIKQQIAEVMIVNGFIEPIVKEIPLEFAVELNRLIQLEMTGSVG
jgi:Fe-S cluster assembly protein SufB